MIKCPYLHVTETEREECRQDEDDARVVLYGRYLLCGGCKHHKPFCDPLIAHCIEERKIDGLAKVLSAFGRKITDYRRLIE